MTVTVTGLFTPCVLLA
jgi:hypothetical protein